MSESNASGPINALTVDVEEHFQVSAFESVVRREDWDGHESRVVSNTERLLDLFDEVDVRATFFCLGWVAERQPALIREIVRRGHEVGSHGYSHRLIYEQTPSEFREELLRSKRLLEELTSGAVEGHRAASFSIGRSNLWALDVIAECGFRYDSSLFPVVHDRYGIPGAPRGIYRLTTPAGHSLIEIPPSTLAVGSRTLPVAGGGYLRLYPGWLTSWAIRRLNRQEARPAVVYVHPWEVDPDQPRIEGAGLVSRFRHYVNLRGTATKLRRLLDRHRFGRMSDLLAEAAPPRSVSLSSEAQSDRAAVRA